MKRSISEFERRLNYFNIKDSNACFNVDEFDDDFIPDGCRPWATAKLKCPHCMRIKRPFSCGEKKLQFYAEERRWYGSEGWDFYQWMAYKCTSCYKWCRFEICIPQ